MERCWRNKFVSHSPDGLNGVGSTPSRFEFLTQCSDMDIDGAPIAEIGIAPDHVQQRLTRKHPIRSRSQRDQKIKLLDGQSDGLLIDRDAPRRNVDKQVSQLNL